MTNLILRDLLFPKCFLRNEIDLPQDLVVDLLDMPIEIKQMGEPDSLTIRSNRIIYSNPSSPMRFLFTLLYGVLSPKLADESHKDKLGLALLGMCRDHVYADFDKDPFNGPPVLVSFEKLDVAQFVLSEVIEPLVGKVQRFPVFFYPCKYTDVCRIVDSRDKLCREYGLQYNALPNSDYPIILTNFSIFNNAARMSSLLSVLLRHQFGDAQFNTIMNSILVQSSLLKNIITIIKTLRTEPLFTVDFLRYISAELLTEEERTESMEMQCDLVAKDKFLSQHVKIADLGNPAGNQQSRVQRQWSQWSMLMGLIEKQLTPARGSMWPATKNLKPFDDRRKAMIAEREKTKGGPLNFEELLEVARDMYNHNAKPGTLIETLLRDNRVWKV